MDGGERGREEKQVKKERKGTKRGLETQRHKEER